MSCSVSELDAFTLRVLREVGVRPEPPIDLELVARQLGIELRRERLDGAAGLLRMTRDRPQVVVDTYARKARARFTLAHELGHYVLAKYPEEVVSIWRGQPSLRDPERFSDRFAESLLLPAEWISVELARGPQTLQRLIWAASTAQVSLSAASVRLTRTGGWRRTLLRLGKVSCGWAVLAVTGLLRPGWRHSLQLTPGADRCLRQADEHAGEPTWLPLLISGDPCYAPAQLSARSGSAIAWVDLLRRRPAAISAPRPHDAAVECRRQD